VRFARIVRSGRQVPAVGGGPRARTVARQAVPLVLQRQPRPVADFDRPLKREADKVAECVLAMPARAGAPRVQRMCGECANELRRQSMEEDEEELLQTRREGADVSVVKVTLASEIGNIRAGGIAPPGIGSSLLRTAFRVQLQ
jgi:hypothetical protein